MSDIVDYVKGKKQLTFKINEAEKNILNSFFTAFELDTEIGIRELILQAAQGALHIIAENKQLKEELKGLQGIPPENQESTKKVNQDLQEVNQSLQNVNRELQEKYAGLQTEYQSLQNVNAELNEGITRLKAKEASVKADLTHAQEQNKAHTGENKILVTLPYFQHHLLSNISQSKALRLFYASVPKGSRGFILPIQDDADLKTVMATILQNFFVGAILEYHKGAGYLPNISAISKMSDITTAVTYARTKLK